MKKIIMITGLLSLGFLASCGQKEVVSVEKVSDPVTQIAVEQELELETLVLTAYSEEMLGQAENTVLFFHSASCGSCRATEKNLLESEIPDDLQVLKINFDEDSELRKKYGVPKYHTFVQVDANGEEIKTWSGSFTLEDIQEQLMITNSEVTQVEEPIVESEAPVVLVGSYQAYDESLVGVTANTVLFFHAEWCGTCKAADAKLREADAPEDLTVLKVDFDEASDLRKKYGVTTQHSFVQVDADGNEMAKWQGSKDFSDIEAQVK